MSPPPASTRGTSSAASFGRPLPRRVHRRARVAAGRISYKELRGYPAPRDRLLTKIQDRPPDGSEIGGDSSGGVRVRIPMAGAAARRRESVEDMAFSRTHA